MYVLVDAHEYIVNLHALLANYLDWHYCFGFTKFIADLSCIAMHIVIVQSTLRPQNLFNLHNYLHEAIKSRMISSTNGQLSTFVYPIVGDLD